MRVGDEGNSLKPSDPIADLQNYNSLLLPQHYLGTEDNFAMQPEKLDRYPKVIPKRGLVNYPCDRFVRAKSHRCVGRL